MSNLRALRICILGHSGVGKSPLANLFKIGGWEPFRVRNPRNAEDAKVCKTPAEYEHLEASHRNLRPLYESPPERPNKLRVYEDWSFFQVRAARQCLQHTAEAKNASVSLRIEIFAPVLLEMLKNRHCLGNAFHLDENSLLVLLLNPTSRSFRDMKEPSDELRLATFSATAERDRAMGKSVDLADSLRRVEHLDGELAAWRELCLLLPRNTVECPRWSHFEFRYISPTQEPSRARVELGKARQSLLDAVGRQSPSFVDGLTGIIRTEKEIQGEIAT